MGRLLLLPTVLCFALSCSAQRNSPTASPDDTSPLPPMGALLLDVEQHQRAAEKQREQYTYHVHLEEQDLNGNGSLKKTTVTDSESLTIDGVRIDRVVARNGKPLSSEEQQKENDRIDKEVAKARERKAKIAAKGGESDTRGDELITTARILELGSFSNPRRVDFDGRSTIVADYAGDPKARTRNAGEGIIRDLVGTIWIDEQDRVLVRGQGRFLNDFKLGGGLLLDVHKGLTFDFRAVKINGEVWLPLTIDAQGSARYLLFGGVNGRVHLVTSDYRKFRATSTIVGSSDALGPDDKPVPGNAPQAAPQPAGQPR